MLLLSFTSNYFLGLCGILGTSAVIWASKRVMDASDTVIAHGEKLDNLTKNFNEHREEQKEIYNQLTDVFSEEIRPINDSLNIINNKISHHGERILIIETHLKINRDL